MTAMRRRFGRTLLMLLMIDAFLAFAFLSARGWSSSPRAGDLFKLGIWAAVVFLMQGYCFARVGLYQGLVQSNSLRATFMLIGKLGLLPYGLFIVVLIGYDSIRRVVGGLPGVGENEAIGLWVMAHMIPCVLFLGHAELRMFRNFRLLATQAGLPGVLRRWHHWLTGQGRATRPLS